MTAFLLIRHGTTDYNGRALAGRLAGVGLNDEGRRQVDRITEVLAAEPIRAVLCSPLQRARETAESLVRRLGLTAETCAGLNEIDFGEWTGRSFNELAQDRRWEAFNRFRSGIRPPGGELMVEVQARVVAETERLRAAFPNELIAIVSHGDVIRSALAHYLGVPIDLALRFEIDTASISALEIGDQGSCIPYINRRP